MTDDKLKPHGDVVVTTGKYTDKDGKERNRYKNIGTLFATPHFSRITIKLDALPMNDGWLQVFKREDARDTVAEVSDEPINLDDIPF